MDINYCHPYLQTRKPFVFPSVSSKLPCHQQNPATNKKWRNFTCTSTRLVATINESSTYGNEAANQLFPATASQN